MTAEFFFLFFYCFAQEQQNQQKQQSSKKKANQWQTEPNTNYEMINNAKELWAKHQTKNVYEIRPVDRHQNGRESNRLSFSQNAFLY